MEGKATDAEITTLETDYSKFDPEVYLECYYSPQGSHLEREDSFVPWALKCLHKAFSEGDMEGDLLVDIGSGPTLYQVMSACEVFNKVILTEFLEVNRNELKLWLQNEGGSKMDWTPFLKKVCELEGRSRSDYTVKEVKLRKTVQDVLHIDVLRPQPLEPNALPQGLADCIVSCFCLDSVSRDLAEFTRALTNIGTLLRPGGHLILIGVLGGRYYCGASGVLFAVLDLTNAQVCQSLTDSGYTLSRLEALKQEAVMEKAVFDGVFFVKARKNSSVKCEKTPKDY
ncbi:phenylethanolamine N-methyltransferase-like [Antennarius striatus]|uniref:phenylethanolamine N-methyltransferase-like n=1 Tax=Antennarius striatus TaxID=241820 RepID=UPI0035ADA0AA